MRVADNLKQRQSPQISLIEELNALFGRSATNSRLASSVSPGNEKPKEDTIAQKQLRDEDGQRKGSIKELKDKNAASTSFVSTTNLLPPPPSNPPKETKKVVIIAEKKSRRKNALTRRDHRCNDHIWMSLSCKNYSYGKSAKCMVRVVLRELDQFQCPCNCVNDSY
uniref:Uncharacterized protein n=1 Tax=Plectus sambesii TaxID=2011161 RepID=A0A914VHY3_9BILA